MEAKFTLPVQTDPEAHPAFCSMGNGSFLEIKRPGLGVDHPALSSALVKEKLHLCLYFPAAT